MNIEKIISDLDNNLVLTTKLEINQEKFDKLINYCIKNDFREKALRLAFSFSNEDLDFSKLVEYYINIKDEWYLSELIYILTEEKINIYNMYQLVKNTKDESFVEYVTKDLMTYFIVKDEKKLIEIINKYK